jgi:hypothetical protein
LEEEGEEEFREPAVIFLAVAAEGHEVTVEMEEMPAAVVVELFSTAGIRAAATPAAPAGISAEAMAETTGTAATLQSVRAVAEGEGAVALSALTLLETAARVGSGAGAVEVMATAQMAVSVGAEAPVQEDSSRR